MLKDLMKPEILDLIESRNWQRLRDVAVWWPAPEVADLVLHLRKRDRVLLFRALPRGLAEEVFRSLAVEQQNELLRDLTDEESRELLASLRPDERTQLLGELPGQATQRMLNLLPQEELEEARWLLGYPDDSVGRLMTPDYVAVRPEWTVREALDHIRRVGRDTETINRIYVTDEDWHLIDDIELRRFILADPDVRVDELMDYSFAAVEARSDREPAVAIIRRYSLLAVPVVDSEGILVGIVTVDDLLDVAEQEATEDFHKVGSVGPIRTSLRDAGVGFLYRRRIVWLLALVFVNIFSGAGIAYFEDVIAAYVALVFFLPLLIDSAGNAGSQAATLIVRALATGDVHISDWFSLVGKELAVAAGMGITMALAVSLVGSFRAPEVVLVVGLTMFVVVVVGSLIGMSMPFLLTRLRLDPATASAPLITSLADITGVLVYFFIASRLLAGA
jgi:magnesium transporter